jgi:hypothetical protein
MWYFMSEFYSLPHYLPLKIGYNRTYGRIYYFFLYVQKCKPAGFQMNILILLEFISDVIFSNEGLFGRSTVLSKFVSRDSQFWREIFFDSRQNLNLLVFG